jgi:hypothetical protein
MDSAIFICRPARYLLQITSKGEWKTVAYLNDLQEIWDTMENVTDLGVIDSWINAEVRSRDRRSFRNSERSSDRTN